MGLDVLWQKPMPTVCRTLPMLAVMLLPLAAWPATPLSVKVRVTPETVKLGEPFVEEIVVTHRPDERYELATPGDLGDFDYLGQERQRVDGADQSTTTLRAKLAAFALGALDTPALTLEVSDADGTTRLDVPRAKVQVVSTLPPDSAEKGAALNDVRQPEAVPVRTWRLLYALAALLAVGALAWALLRWLKRPRPDAAALAAQRKPLEVRTLEALDALDEEGLPARGLFKSFYFQLSQILRGYLGERYGVDALESTTPELLQALRRLGAAGLPLDDIAEFAGQSDFVRYAKSEPSIDDCKAHLDLAYRVVRGTTPVAPATDARPAPPPPPARR